MNNLSRAELELLANASEQVYNDELEIGAEIEVGDVISDYTLVLKETHGEQRDRDAWLVGFGGQAYFSESDNRLVIAFEGSDGLPVPVQDWIHTNIPMALGFTSDQSASAMNFALEAIREHATDGTEVVFSGHSLGGYLAQVALLWTAGRPELDGLASAQAVVLNAPGWGGLTADPEVTPTADVTYIYSEDWGRLLVPAIHSLGERLSDAIFYLPGTTGHDIEPLRVALATLDPIPTSGNGPRLLPSASGHADQNYWEVFNEALDRRTNFTFEWSFDNGSGLRYTIEQRLHPGRDVRNDGETSVAFVIRTSVRTEDGRVMTPAEMRDIGLESMVVGTRHESGNWTWEERCFLAGTPITLPDGTTKPISAICAGDTVLSYAADGALTPASYKGCILRDLVMAREIPSYRQEIGEKYGLVDPLCFPASTPTAVSLTATRPICDIRVGDTVLAFDPAADLGLGALVQRKVVWLYRHTTDEWVKLTWVEGGETKELVATPGHLFEQAQAVDTSSMKVHAA